MGQTTNGLIKPLTATTRIPARTLVKYGATGGTGVPAVDATAFIFGVSSEIDTEVGERCSTFGVGCIADVIYGGTVNPGDALTADANGRAITTTTTGAKCVGFAEIGGVLGDIGTVVVTPFIL